MASGAEDGLINIYDWLQECLLDTLEGHTSWVMVLCKLAFQTVQIFIVCEFKIFFQKGLLKEQFLLSGGADKRIIMWNIGTGEITREFLGHTGAIKSLTILPNDCLASGSTDKSIKLWDSSTGMLIRTCLGHKNDVSSLAQLNSTKMVTKNTIKI